MKPGAMGAVCAAAFLAAAALLATPAWSAEAAVPKVIKIIVPYPPGGSTDLVARQLGNGLARRFGNSVISENRAGGGSTIGSAAVAKAAPDGATLLLNTTALTITAGIQDKLPYDPVTDLVPVAMLTQVPMLLAVPANAPYKNVGDLLNAARARPGALNYGTSGIGASNHMAMELLKTAAKVNLVHVPYRGMGPATTDLATGQVQAIIATYSSLAPMLQSGKVRALAVSSLTASPFSPDLPPIAATVPGFSMATWFGVFAPRHTPAPLVDLYNREIRAIITNDDFTRFLTQERAEASTLDLAGMAAQMRAEVAQWKRLAQEQNIKAE